MFRIFAWIPRLTSGIPDNIWLDSISSDCLSCDFTLSFSGSSYRASSLDFTLCGKKNTKKFCQISHHINAAGTNTSFSPSPLPHYTHFTLGASFSPSPPKHHFFYYLICPISYYRELFLPIPPHHTYFTLGAPFSPHISHSLPSTPYLLYFGGIFLPLSPTSPTLSPPTPYLLYFGGIFLPSPPTSPTLPPPTPYLLYFGGIFLPSHHTYYRGIFLPPGPPTCHTILTLLWGHLSPPLLSLLSSYLQYTSTYGYLRLVCWFPQQNYYPERLIFPFPRLLYLCLCL